MKFNYFFYTNFFNSDQCNNLRQVLKKNINHKLSDIPAKDVAKTADVGIVLIKSVRSEINSLIELAFQANKEYFGFEIYNPTDYDAVNYNEYREEKLGRYDWHTDFPLDLLYHTKLTVLVNLSPEKYEGGKFELFYSGSNEIKEFDQPGSVLIFPSWTPHRVTPVTSGIRCSMTLFMTGPKVR